MLSFRLQSPARRTINCSQSLEGKHRAWLKQKSAALLSRGIGVLRRSAGFGNLLLYTRERQTHFRMDTTVRGQNFMIVEAVRLAREGCHDTSSLAYQKHSCCGIPGMQTHLPESVKSPEGY